MTHFSVPEDHEPVHHFEMPTEIVDRYGRSQSDGMSFAADYYPEDGVFALSAAAIRGLAESVRDGDSVRFALPLSGLGVELDTATASSELSFMDGNVVLDTRRRTLFVEGAQLPLTLKEYELMRFLGINVGQCMTREEIGANVWGADHAEAWKANPKAARTVDVHARRCRQKLGSYGWMLYSVRGVGYIFDVKPFEQAEQE